MQHQTKKCQCVACGGKSIPACYRSRQLAASAQARLNKEGCGGVQSVHPQNNPISIVSSVKHVQHVPRIAKQSVDEKDQLIKKLESELFESQNQKTALMVGFGIFASVIGMSIYLKK
jgi:hypothetical protein